MATKPCHRPGADTEPCGVLNVVNHLGTPDFPVLHRLSPKEVPINGYGIMVVLAHAVYSVRRVYSAGSQQTGSFAMFHHESIARQAGTVMRSSPAEASKFVRQCLSPLPDGLGIRYRRRGYRGYRSASRQQPPLVPPLLLPWRRLPTHPPYYRSLVQSPPPITRHLIASQQPHLGFPDRLRLGPYGIYAPEQGRGQCNDPTSWLRMRPFR